MERRIGLESYAHEYSDIDRFSFVLIQDGQALQVFRPAMTNPEEIREWAEKEFDIEQSDASTEIISQNVPQKEGITITCLPSPKRKIHSYLETIDIE